MKRILLILLLAPVFGFSQVLLPTSIDKVSGDTIFKTTNEVISGVAKLSKKNPTALRVEAVRTGQNIALAFAVLYAATGDSVKFNRGDTVSIQLTSGQTLHIHYPRTVVFEANPESAINGGMLKLPLTAEQQQILLQDEVASIRFTHTNGTLDYVIVPGKGGAIKKVLGLVVK